jgi:glycosyltransferase involved in cell wall biosynthesis
MSGTPELTILTPVKNAAPWLEACLHSTINQSFTHWEWIFIDDHSTDKTPLVLKAFAATDPRIRVYKNPGNGILPALQKGLALAQGCFVTRMDADDIMPPNRLTRFVEGLRSAPAKTLITGNVQYFSHAPVSTGYQHYEQWLNQLNTAENHWDHLYRECIIASPNWIMRTEELCAAGGFNNLDYPEDYDLCFRCYQHGFRIQTIPHTTLLWREHPHRTSRTHEHYQQAAFFKLKLTRFIQVDYRVNRPLVLLGTGKKARLSAVVLQASTISFSWLGLSRSTAQIGKQKHVILPLDTLATLKNPLVLIAIYPAKAEREKLEQHLHRFNLRIGKDYWYL